MERVLDILITNGSVIDGSGKSAFAAVVGISGHTIELVDARCRKPPARKVIDAGGGIIAPGFIDMHGHSDITLLKRPPELGKIKQGITTEVIGGCGFSPAPLTEKSRSLVRSLAPLLGDAGVPWRWRSFGQYLRAFERRPPVTNVVPIVGHHPIRIAALGVTNRRVTRRAMRMMKALLEGALADGARGLSSGLIYPPGFYAREEELTELCKVVARRNGIYATHMRNEKDRLLESIEETIRTAKNSDVSVEIVHLKAAGRENWRKVGDALKLIRAARREGVDVSFDQYPYTAGSTTLVTALPDWAHEGGMARLLVRVRRAATRARLIDELARRRPDDWRRFFVTSVSSRRNKRLEGKSVKKIARLRHCSPMEAVLDIITEERANVGMIHFSMCEENIREILKESIGTIGTDGLPGTKPHPRLYGSFPRVLGKYVREEKVIPLELAVKKMTSLAAERLRLTGRGRIAEGYAADVVVFDPDVVADTATYQRPLQFPKGIECVIVNGKVAVRRGRFTGTCAGKVL